MNQVALQKLVNNFVNQLQSLWQQEAIAALTGKNGHNGLRIGNGRGVKRTADDLEQLADQFVEFIVKNPGLRIEQINKQLGTTTKDLQLPIRKLIAEKRIKAKGNKRATTYFANK